jgi:hypothetical protein
MYCCFCRFDKFLGTPTCHAEALCGGGSLSTRRLVTPKSNVGGSLVRRLVGDGGNDSRRHACAPSAA